MSYHIISNVHHNLRLSPSFLRSVMHRRLQLCVQTMPKCLSDLSVIQTSTNSECSDHCHTTRIVIQNLLKFVFGQRPTKPKHFVTVRSYNMLSSLISWTQV